VLVTDIVGVELPEEQDPADVDVVNVTVGQLTVLDVAAVYEPEDGFEVPDLYCHEIVVPCATALGIV
jgi:hypothetical protein